MVARCIAFLLLAGLASPLAAADDFTVVVQESNPATALARQDLSRMFLKQTTTWKDGSPVVPVDQADTSPTRAQFCKAIHSRDIGAVKSFWQRQIFSGVAVPPAEKASDEEVIRFVRATRGAVGYVKAGAPLGKGVKAITITD
jgi:ABC-type phosphate transport system substrate-binding protein